MGSDTALALAEDEKSPLLSRCTAFFVYLFERLIPDPYVFAVILTFAGALLAFFLAPNGTPTIYGLVLGGLGEQEALQVVLVGQRPADRPPGGRASRGRGRRDPVGWRAPRGTSRRAARPATPAGRSAAARRPAWRRAPGGRITRPNTMPGSTRSCRNRGRPVALSGRSSRGALRPATDHSAAPAWRAPGRPAGPAGPARPATSS